MSKGKFRGVFILLLICQMLLCNYCNFSPFVTVTILPAMIICMPMSVKTPGAMLIAFLTALAVDFTTDAVPGLNALALVPVAFIRPGLMKIIIDKDITDRVEFLSFRTKGFMAVSLIILISVSVFLLIYIVADGAGTKPLYFNAIRFAASLAASYILSLAVVWSFSMHDKP